jgi:Membrane domain of glycerophosphoryl diester phosphodiesterase
MVEAGDLVQRSFALLRLNIRSVLGGTAVLTALGVAMDSGGLGATLLFFSAWFLLQTIITSNLMNKLDLVAGGEWRSNRFGAVFGVSMLSGIGILFGYLLLIIPGIILTVRWMVCVPSVIGTADGVGEAIRDSWEKTRGHFWPLFFASLIALLPVALVMAITGYYGFQEAQAGRVDLLNSTWMSVGTNLVSTLSSILNWHLAVAAYEAIATPRETLEEIFA